MTKPKIIFHIGLERTGTTSFQRYCTNNTNILKKYSVLYPTKNSAFSVDSHGPLVASYLPNDKPKDFAIRSVSSKRPALLRSLLGEIKKSSADTILISSEHFSSRFGEAEISQLAADFAGYDFRIAVIIRDHLSRFCSSYSTSIMSGGQRTIEEYADEIFAPDNKYARYRDTIIRWEEMFGRENISVFCHSRGKNIITTLFENLIAPGKSLPPPSSYADNRSLGPSLTEALRLTNIELSSHAKCGAPRTYLRWLRQRYVQVCLKQWLIRAAGDQSLDHWQLSEHNLRRLNEIAEIDRRWLEDRYGVRLPQPDGARYLPNHPAGQPASAEILAKALVEQARGGRWDVIDAATPALLPLMRTFGRWQAMRSSKS